jgi:hypothetical protein
MALSLTSLAYHHIYLPAHWRLFPARSEVDVSFAVENASN